VRTSFAPLERALGALTWSETVTVSRVDLMRSTAGPAGAVYEELRRGRLS